MSINDTWSAPVDYDIFRNNDTLWSRYANFTSSDSSSKYFTTDPSTLLNTNFSQANVQAQEIAYLVQVFDLDPKFNWDTPRYYSYSYRIIGTLFQGIIFLVGLLGNSLVVIVVLRSRSMRTPTNCYLVSLALADSVVLLSSVPTGIVAYFLIGDKWSFGKLGCSLFTFLQFLGINASSLSIAAFTVERYIAICHPMLAHKMCTVRRAKRIILYVWLFATIYCAPWLTLTRIEYLYYVGVGETPTCNFALARGSYKIYFLFDMVLFYAVPLFISCILYALIARILYRSDVLQSSKNIGSKVTIHFSKNGSRRSTQQQQQQNAPNIAVESGTPSHGSENHLASLNDRSNQSLNTASVNTSRKQQQQQPVTSGGRCAMKKNVSAANDSSRVQVVKMLAVVVAVFATLWLPYRGMVLYNSFIVPPYKELWYLMFAKTMIFVNSAINPIIYSACSIKFRREFKKMLTCGSKSASARDSYLRSRAAASTAQQRQSAACRSRNGSMASIAVSTGRSMSGVLIGQRPPPSHSISMANLRRHSTASQQQQHQSQQGVLCENPLRRESSQYLSPDYCPTSPPTVTSTNTMSRIRSSASVSKLATCTKSAQDCSSSRILPGGSGISSSTATSPSQVNIVQSSTNIELSGNGATTNITTVISSHHPTASGEQKIAEFPSCSTSAGAV